MNERITITDIQQIKDKGRRFAAVSCYDYTTARLAAEAGVEMILVGDSAAQVVLGHDSTLPATMDFMVTITEAVRRAAPGVCLAADMPFLSYQTSIADAVRNAGRFIQQAGAQIVKIEIKRSHLDIVKAVSDADIPVMAHLGIRPQSVAKQVRLRAEGATAEQAYELITLAEDAVRAGASMVLLEGTARETAAIITRRLAVPVISCGSGPDCDGQILIINDILGLSLQPPKFAKAYAQLAGVILSAVKKYAEQVRAGRFPDDPHSYHIKSEQKALLKKMSAQSGGQ
ncbi:MAG: 3-methyl-2-oxobutanoate hydroxymethyltransferase [Planctomycetes bacterium]|nr:3-methyl-2-oxobutanoate hydroxymethyltransferase [Planctomycetota bacterium]